MQQLKRKNPVISHPLSSLSHSFCLSKFLVSLSLLLILSLFLTHYFVLFSLSQQLDIVLPIVKPNFEAAKSSHDGEDENMMSSIVGSTIGDTQSATCHIPSCTSSFNHSSSMAVTWLGHASVVVQMDGVTFITDPIFSDRASPSQMVGPKRYRDPPCSIHDLPSDLDAVLISHNHYDHLDMNSVTLLNARFWC